MNRTIDLHVEAIAVQAQAPLDVSEVFAREGDYVYTSLRRLGVPTASLEDAVHDVFIAVHNHRAEYDPSRPLRAWLFGYALRVASNHRRTNRRRPVSGAPPADTADDRPGADELLESNARRRLLLRALATLSEERKAVLVLHDLDEVAVPEIARTLGIPLNTAYSRLRLAREDIRAAIQLAQNGRGS